MDGFINIGYIAAAIIFVLGVKMLTKQQTARSGNLLSAVGMLVAVGVTLFHADLNFGLIIAGVVLGAVIGLFLAFKVQMTEMPELVAALNGSGAAASLLVGWLEYHKNPAGLNTVEAISMILAVLIGGFALSGSVVAWGKLSEKFFRGNIRFPNHSLLTIGAVLLVLLPAIMLVLFPASSYWALILLVMLALGIGLLIVLPIGGADMPIVISLMNSLTGVAASAAGFILSNSVLIVTGALVGASGLILTQIMCKSMNRSLWHVLFGSFGQTAGTAMEVEGEIQPMTPEDAYYILEAATSVVFVPGYGMAVAQAQHAVKELADLLEENGAEVKYAIHPVAGRMPGHMNVLLAEANVSYEQLVEPGDVNPTMELTDVAVVIGANDVVNPAAKEDPGSPLYGMPIIEADRARTTFILKRSMNPGFAGVENPLFYKPNSRMLFGDARDTVSALVAEFKEAQN